MGDGDNFFDFLKAMGILLISFMLLYIVTYPLEDHTVYDITEHVVNKEIIHNDLNNNPDYYIYTDNYCFSIDLTEYNQLKVGDSVTISVTNNTSNVNLLIDDLVYNNI